MTRVLARSPIDDAFQKGDARARAAAHRRIAHLAAGGHSAAAIAAIEGADEVQIETLLGDEAISRMVRAYKVLEAKPPEQRRAELIRIAQFLIDEAIGLGHVRVAFFVVREELHGRDAAETVADKLIRQRERAAEPPPPIREPAAAADAPRRAHLPAHPADRMAQRACRDLMRALLAEFRVRAEAAARTAARAALAAARGAASLPSTDRRRKLSDWLLTGTALPAPPGTLLPKLSQAP